MGSRYVLLVLLVVGYRLEKLDSDFEISGDYYGSIDDYTDDIDIIHEHG